MRRLALFLSGLYLASPLTALADVKDNLCKGANYGGGSLECGDKGDTTAPLTGSVKSITETLLVIAGAIAVIVIIISGIRYITSTGDATRIKQSKDTLLYAVVGLVVVVLAYAIVHFVANHIK